MPSFRHTLFESSIGYGEATLRPEERDLAQAGELTLHCPRMNISLQGSGSVRLVGGGTISQQHKGPLQITLYAGDCPAEAFNAIFGPLQRLERGIIQAEDQFALEAIDGYNRLWRANDLLLHGNFGNGAIVRSSSHQVVAESGSLSAPSKLVTYSPVPVTLPTNTATATRVEAADESHDSRKLDVWHLQTPALSVALRRLESGLRVTSTARSGKLPAGLDTRIDEALWFTLGVLTDWTVLHEESNSGVRTTIRSIPGYPSTRVDTPWIRLGSGTPDQLFNAYLNYVLDGPAGRFHPLSVIWRVVLGAASQTIADRARALGVAVETLINRFLPSLKAETEDSRQEIVELSAHLALLAMKDSLRKRMEGCLCTMRAPSTGAALRKLTEAGLLADSHVDSWKAIRHRTAHSIETNLEIEELLVHCTLVHQALTLLTFQVINYSGEYADHSSKGSPTRHFEAVAL